MKTKTLKKSVLHLRMNLLQFLNLHDCTFNWNNNKNIATLWLWHLRFFVNLQKWLKEVHSEEKRVHRIELNVDIAIWYSQPFALDNARSSFSMSSFFAMNYFYIMNLTSMEFLLDRICIKRPRSSYITLFSEIYMFQSVFHWIILNKINKSLLFHV